MSFKNGRVSKVFKSHLTLLVLTVLVLASTVWDLKNPGSSPRSSSTHNIAEVI
jgi:hypothetical protein